MRSNELAAVMAHDEGKPLMVLGDQVRVRARAHGDAYAVAEVDSQNAGPPLHRHDWDETYFVLSGAMEVQVGGRIVHASTGMSIHIPGGTPHSYSTRETSGCRFLAVISPGVAVDFFEELHNVTAAGQADMATVMAVAKRYGVTPA
jgi:mannose-6-phosphate isomerase-like protein (cupin superfamily)